MVIEVVIVKPSEMTVEQKIETVARETGVASTTLYSLLFNESTLNPDAAVDIPPTKGCPDGSVDRGIAQINDCYHPEVTDEQAYSVDFGIQWAADVIKKDRAWAEYAVCNCYTFVKTIVGDLPNFKDLKSNTTPRKGVLAIFNYSGVKHLGYIQSLNETGFTVREANFKPCTMGTRHIGWNDPALIGFYQKPGTSPTGVLTGKKD